MTLDALMVMASDFIEKTVVGSKTQLSPTWIVPMPDDELHVVVTPWANHFERQVMLAEIRRLLRDTGAPAYAIVSEVWLTTHKGTSWPEDGPEPRLDPQRQEKVAAYAVARSGERQVRLWDITRDYKGTIRLLTVERGVRENLGGALVKMFEDR
jgi:hypothetical protein